MATEHVTTNIRFPKALYQAAKRRALSEHKSLAQVVRESVAQYVARPSGDPEGVEPWNESPPDPVLLIGTDPIAADVTDASDRVDEYLYGPIRTGSDEAET